MTRSRTTRTALAAVAVTLTAAVLLPTTGKADLTWQRIGSHPDAVNQPSARGKTLHDLHGFAGRVYVGYGDYGDNTGPVNHRPWNPLTGQWESEGLQDTEEVNNYQPINGILFSPSIDPACCAGPLEFAPNASDYATLNGNRQWPDQDKFASFHVFDIRGMGSALIASGSSPDPGTANGLGCGTSCATVWRSDNGGADWYRWYRDPTDSSNYYGGHRCYELATFGNRAWANCTTGYKTFNGSAWVADSQQYAHKEATVFAGNLVTPARGALLAFNGSERVVRSGSHRFVAVDGGRLYAVSATGTVTSTTDLASWSTVGTVPSSATSFTALNGRLYYGDAASTLYAATVESVPTPTTTTTTASPTTTPPTTQAPTTTTTTGVVRPPTTRPPCSWLSRLLGAC